MQGIFIMTITYILHLAWCRRLETLKSGKSAEHFKHADRCINILLSIFYTSVITHGHLPGDFMKTIIIPYSETVHF